MAPGGGMGCFPEDKQKIIDQLRSELKATSDDRYRLHDLLLADASDREKVLSRELEEVHAALIVGVSFVPPLAAHAERIMRERREAVALLKRTRGSHAERRERVRFLKRLDGEEGE